VQISVALATFDGERHLEAQLESLAAQTLVPSELVVGDDGSTDRTLAIVEAFAARSPFPVRVLRHEYTAGFADNFLRTASSCRSELIAFCDQDDVWLPAKLERCAAAFADPEVVLAIHVSRVVDDALRDTGARFPRIDRPHVVAPLAGHPWERVRGMGMVFSARLLTVPWSRRPPSHYRPGGVLNHDEWVMLLAQVTGAIAYLDEPLALYRQHGANAVGAPSRGAATRLRELRGAGSGYYATRAGQARESAALFGSLAAAEPSVDLRARYEAGERYHRAFASALERRGAVYADGAGVTRRLGALLSLAGSGAYRARERGGFGSRALVKDAAASCLRWLR
jgi:hypothetical protein